jgi:hypothetical protein
MVEAKQAPEFPFREPENGLANFDTNITTIHVMH